MYYLHGDVADDEMPDSELSWLRCFPTSITRDLGAVLEENGLAVIRSGEADGQMLGTVLLTDSEEDFSAE